MRGLYDQGGLNFANLNQPRDVYDSPPPFDVSNFEEDPFGSILPNIGLFSGGRLEGEYCQKHGLTELGEFLMVEMMKRGMIIEVDHFPPREFQTRLRVTRRVRLSRHGYTRSELQRPAV